MDRRMMTYGNQIFSYPSNRNISMTPAKNRDYYSKLNDKLTDLSDDLISRRKRQQEAEIVTSLSQIASKISSPVKEPPSQDYSIILNSFQKQQEMMMNLIQGLIPNQNKREHSREWSRKRSHYEEEPKKVRKPEEVKNILAEANFDDDGAEDYADQEKKIKFSTNLSDEEKYKIIAQTEKKKYNNVKAEGLKGIRRFRMIGIVVLFPIMYISEALEKRAKFYSESQRNIEYQIQVFYDVGQSWIKKVMKVPLIATINDPDLDFTLTNRESEIRNQTINTRIIKLQVRINGILDGLLTFTTVNDLPGPLKGFVLKLTQNRSYLPKDFLTEFEKTRLEFNEFGGLVSMNEDKKKMIICFFFITKILVKQFCLNPIEVGIPVTRKGKVFENLRTIASILQITVVLNFLKVGRRTNDALAEELEYVKRKRGTVPSATEKSNEDGVSEKLLYISEFEASFHYISPFIELIRKKMYAWAGKLLDICENKTVKNK